MAILSTAAAAMSKIGASAAKATKAVAKTAKSAAKTVAKVPGNIHKRRYDPKRLAYKSAYWEYKRKTALPNQIGKTVRSLGKSLASANIAKADLAKSNQSIISSLTQEVQRGQRNDNGDTAIKSTVIDGSISGTGDNR